MKVNYLKFQTGARATPYRNTGAINNPIPYVNSASPTPTTVISAPLFNHDRPVTITFDAPTAKCATVLMANDQIRACVPDKNKNGITGTNAPAAVLNIALVAALHGLGKPFSDKPSSSCASVFNNCSGCSASRPAIIFASSTENPFNW